MCLKTHFHDQKTDNHNLNALFSVSLQYTAEMGEPRFTRLETDLCRTAVSLKKIIFTIRWDGIGFISDSADFLTVKQERPVRNKTTE